MLDRFKLSFPFVLQSDIKINIILVMCTKRTEQDTSDPYAAILDISSKD